jgi:hypothetical protein
MSLSDYGLLDDFSFRGRWWLPNNPADCVPGTLSFSNGRIQLELDSSFSVPELEPSNLLLSPTIFRAGAVHGRTTDGDLCTVLQVVAFEVSQGIVRLRGNTLITGVHWQEEANLRIQKAVLNFAHLDEWGYQKLYQQGTGATKDSFTFVLPTEAKTLLHIEDVPPLKELTLVAQLQIKLERTQTSLLNRNYFLVDFKQAVDLPVVNSIVKDIGNLLSLLVGEAVQPLKIRLTLSDDSHSANPYIDYFLGLRGPSVSKKSGYDMPLPFAVLGKAEAAVLFKNWFLNEKILRPVYGLLLSTVYEPDQYVQSTFLSLIQGLETFHRHLYEGRYVPKEEYEETRKLLVGVIPPQTKTILSEKLKGMLNWGNEFSLRDRLKELLDSVSHESWQQLANHPEQKDFISVVVNVRNYLTHYKEAQKPDVIENLRGMYNLNQKLRAILTLLLLKHLGMDEKQIAKPLGLRLGLAC